MRLEIATGFDMKLTTIFSLNVWDIVTIVPKCIKIVNTSLGPLLLEILWTKLTNEKHIRGQNDYLKTYSRTEMTNERDTCGCVCNFDLIHSRTNVTASYTSIDQSGDLAFFSRSLWISFFGLNQLFW